MLLTEFIEELGNGELDGVNLGHNDETGVSGFNNPKLVTYINSGLVDLYTRFPLKTREVIIRQYTAVTMYRLSKEFAQTNTESDVPHKYIEDTEAVPFVDRILKIDEVYTGEGCKLPINNPMDCNSVFTPSIDTVQIPNPEHPRVNSVIYRAAPIKLLAKCDHEQVIELPLVLIQALKTFVTAKVYSEKMDQLSTIKAGNYLMQYNDACRLVEQHGLTLDNNTPNTRLERNGWI